ncbi:MAG: malonyl-CoA synthase [Granulosicoccus sp.]
MSNHLFDALLAARSRAQDALFVANGQQLVDNATFFDLVARISSVLLAVRVKPGDRVAAQVHKSHEALALYLACLRVGAVFLPLNTAYTQGELQYFIDDATPQLFVVDPESEKMARQLLDAARVLTLSSDGKGTLADAASQAAAMDHVVPRSADDLAAILYTSGTTGRSKGAMLTHENLLSNALTLVQLWHFSADDVLLHALPVFHTHGLFVASNVMLLCGGSMIFQPRFDIEAVLASLPDANTMMGVPTFYTRLLSDQRFTKDLVGHMRLFISGSAPLLADTHHEFEARTGQRILERYGMTETNMNTSNPYDGQRVAGTVGLPLPGVSVRICDQQTHIPVSSGDVGVLHVKGPNVFCGYWQMPEKTAEELLPDGYFVTGDLATIDDEGYITIVGRSKDLIISGGYNIYPKEIELMIDELDSVVESAVVGVPHADFGESVVAVVVPAAHTAVSLDASAVLDFLDGKLARFKLPRRVEFVDELPRNAMGKVQKNILREQCSQ